MQKVIGVTIKGVVPLLMHRFPEEKQTGEAVVVNGVRDYSGDAELSLYKSPDGVIYQPSTHIEGCMLTSAAKFQIPGKGRKTYKDLFKCAIVVSPDAIPHKFQNWVVDRRSVVIQIGKKRNRIMRERPRFDEWELDFEILVMDAQIPVKTVNQVLVDAGQYVGIGDYRPKFGRFMVTKFEEKK